MDSIKKGKLGYNILEKELLKRNWDIYVPILEDTKVDCIISKNNQLLKLQIKITQLDKRSNYKMIPVRKISHNQGEYKIHHYTANEIDYFIGIDLETEDIYIIPVEVSSKYNSTISVNVLSNYKNNFSQMELAIGNDSDAADDIGECLTANTEGIE